jgi:hypothetical protein
MPTNTYTSLATVTLSTATSSVTFSSIPNTYRDLIFIVSGQLVNNTATDTLLRVNGDSSSSYSRVYMYSNGVVSGSDTTTSFLPWYTRNNQGNSIGHLMDYSATDKHKTLLVRSNEPTTDGLSAQAQRWANTSAITSMTFSTSNNYAAGTTFSLYGVIA